MKLLEKLYLNAVQQLWLKTRIIRAEHVFPLCWLFNYIEVGKPCIYGALTECELVPLKCCQANALSQKAVPLGLLHSSTRLLVTTVCLPALKERPFCQALAHAWKVQLREGGVYETCHPAQLSEGTWGDAGEKPPGCVQKPPLKTSKPYSLQTNPLT